MSWDSFFDTRRLQPLLWLSIGVALAAHGGEPVQFNRDVRPILSDNCFACHGPDPGSRKANLRLDQREGFFTKRDEGTPVVAGKPQESLLVRRINTRDEDDLMPPPKSHKKLTRQQKDLLTRWVKEGARWEPHWSFIAPTRPIPPKVRDAKWAKNPIDQFVLARLAQNHLKPAPEADRRTLARRVALDLTGLPPKSEDIEAFVADKSLDAYEKLVDKLLASPHYGEHRARYWLDAARYADTHGLHFDNYREMWPYRDWVINAFNRNIPFDQFAVEQLAGDLLPTPTQEQRIATGLQRCNITTNEGGTIAEENEANYARDRVETTGQIFLGLTLGCATCHDHKFDPISTKEFYQLSAFYRNTTQGALDGNIADTPPILVVPSEMDAPRWNELPTVIEVARQKQSAYEKEIAPVVKEWSVKLRIEDFEQPVGIENLELYLPLRGGKAQTARNEPELDTVLKESSPSDAKEQASPNENVPKVTPLPPAAATITNEAAADRQPILLPDGIEWAKDDKRGDFLQLKDKTALDLGTVGDFERTDSVSYGAWVKPSDKVASAALLARMDEDAAFRGWDIWVENNGRRVGTHIIHKWDENAIKVMSESDVLKPNEWNHVFITYNGNSKASGIKVFVNGVAVKTKTEKDTLKDTIRTQTPTRLGARSKSLFLGGGVQDVRLYQRKLDNDEVARVFEAGEVRFALGLPADKTDRETKLRAHYLKRHDEKYQKLGEVLAELEKEKETIRKRSPVTHVMQEKNSTPKARVLFRGQYDQPRDEVMPAVLAALNPMPQGAPTNRLGLAKWLVASENPLTARVTANRFWQEIFGTGLVKTSEDFGIMGENPSHPELLDWLAMEFRESGWDMKKFFKLLVTSAAYRQAAVATREKLERDPQNRLLSRGPRFRMDAEMIRDYGLATSGLLADKLGGAPVRPYQPEGVWEIVGMPGSDTRNYKRDKGEKLYRRSLYSFWKRMAPPPSMEVFNAPSREVCTVRRERTNTPLQALVTLNDPQFVEAARALAERTLKEGGATTETRLDYIARRLLARPFRKEELAVVKLSVDKLAAYYQAHPDDAKALIAVGESKPDAAIEPMLLAAWTMTANQLMNLDEALNK